LKYGVLLWQPSTVENNDEVEIINQELSHYWIRLEI
jgi:hypothetical protein